MTGSVLPRIAAEETSNADKAQKFMPLPPAGEHAQAWERILAREIAAGRTPSAQYYLFDQDRIIRHFCSGLADMDQTRKVDADTTYNAFSVTKTFTALAVMQLAEKGQIDIDASVINYLPGFSYGRELTVRQLLSHSAGIPNPIPLSWIHLPAEHQGFDAHRFFKKIFDKHGKSRSKPNEKFMYSNLGYLVLGQLIEQISGKSYEAYVAENIIARLPLEAGDLAFEIPDPAKHAKGYHRKWSFTNLAFGLFLDKATFMGRAEGRWKPFRHYYVNGAPYGGLIGKPIAFVKYVQALLRSDSRLLSPACKQRLFEENRNAKGEPTGMCLSWFTGQLNGQTYFAHAGGGGGYYCEVRVYPGSGLGSVVFFNRTGMTHERFLDRVDGLP